MAHISKSLVVELHSKDHKGNPWIGLQVTGFVTGLFSPAMMAHALNPEGALAYMDRPCGAEMMPNPQLAMFICNWRNEKGEAQVFLDRLHRRNHNYGITALVLVRNRAAWDVCGRAANASRFVAPVFVEDRHSLDVCAEARAMIDAAISANQAAQRRTIMGAVAECAERPRFGGARRAPPAFGLVLGGRS